MSETDSQDPSNTEGDGKTEDESTHRDRPNKLEMQTHALKIEAESVDESVEELADILSPKMNDMMEHHLRGEMEVLEAEEKHPLFSDL